MHHLVGVLLSQSLDQRGELFHEVAVIVALVAAVIDQLTHSLSVYQNGEASQSVAQVGDATVGGKVFALVPSVEVSLCGSHIDAGQHSEFPVVLAPVLAAAVQQPERAQSSSRGWPQMQWQFVSPQKIFGVRRL